MVGLLLEAAHLKAPSLSNSTTKWRESKAKTEVLQHGRGSWGVELGLECGEEETGADHGAEQGVRKGTTGAHSTRGSGRGMTGAPSLGLTRG